MRHAFAKVVRGFTVFTVALTLTIALLAMHAGAQTWTQLSPAGSFPHMAFGPVSVSDGNGNMIVFGGQNGGGGVYTDTWVLTNANGTGPADPATGTTTPTWIQLSTGTAPAFAEYRASFYNPLDNQFVVAGGENGGATPPYSSSDAVRVLTNANGIGGSLGGRI